MIAVRKWWTTIILLSEIIIFNVRVSVCYDTVGLSDVGKITFYFLPSVSSWSWVFSCVRTSVINVDVWERMWTVWDRLVLHGQLVGHWLVHLWCILQYCKVRSQSGFTSNKSGGPADKYLFDLQDKLSLLTADIARRGKSGWRNVMINTSKYLILSNLNLPETVWVGQAWSLCPSGPGWGCWTSSWSWWGCSCRTRWTPTEGCYEQSLWSRAPSHRETWPFPGNSPCYIYKVTPYGLPH